jgi:hypothetical protein
MGTLARRSSGGWSYALQHSRGSSSMAAVAAVAAQDVCSDTHVHCAVLTFRLQDVLHIRRTAASLASLAFTAHPCVCVDRELLRLSC